MTEDATGDQGRSIPDLLLVEDNPLHLRLVKSMLADIWPPNEVARIRHARTLDEAVAAVAAQPPECVLLDLVLPDADGLDSLNTIRAADPLVPIIVLSAHENAKLARAAIDAGAQDYLVKGAVSPQDLQRAVAFAMGRKDHERRAVESAPGVTPWPANHPVTEAAATTKERSAIGVAVIASDGSILFMEDSLASALGRTVSEAAAIPIEDLIHPNDLRTWAKLAAGDPGPTDVRCMHPSGHPIQFRVTAQLMTAAGEQSGAVVASFYLGGEPGTSSSGAYVIMTDWG